jgi:hypothetical protein
MIRCGHESRGSKENKKGEAVLKGLGWITDLAEGFVKTAINALR